jgi:uncharacterized repeat protein (TIGR03803 family)
MLMKVLRIPLAVVLVLLTDGIFRAEAGTETVLHYFASNPYDGEHPEGVLVQGIDGNFYGTTEFGTVSSGTVFRISPSGNESILYYFFFQPYDGEFPKAGLVQGSDGNFYGTTSSGGTSTNCSQGCGTVFRISPTGNYTNLYSFTGAPDGESPQAGLMQGSDGNFYGTTSSGGTHDAGTVFRITPGGSKTILYSFGGSPDGAVPLAGLVQGRDGNFYGTTYAGGKSTSYSSEYGTGAGSVFRISPSGTYTNLYSFGSSPNDSLWPNDGLVVGSDGNFYGTTMFGGARSEGSVFRISPNGSETVLFSFGYYLNDGVAPYAGVMQGSDGNFYGTTDEGGTNGDGTVFRISPNGNYTNLYSFGSSSNDGQNPLVGLAQGNDGNFYGTTYFGGTNGQGIVFKIDVGLGPVTNNYISISPTNAMFLAAGGSGSISVTASNGCAWKAISTDSFITITSGFNGFGNGSVDYTMAANTNTSVQIGTITIAGQTFTVTDAAAPVAILTVSTNGVGSLIPNDNGASLQVGNSYSITAMAVAGFVFTNWTGGTNLPLTVLTNGPAVQFVMEPNLILQANFMDLTKPTLTITNVPAGLSVSNAAFMVKGKASDNWQVANVFYSLNSGGWSNAVTVNSWTNWTAAVTLLPGTNTIAAYAVDPAGDASLTSNISLFFVVTNQLQIRAIGLGTILPNYGNAWLNIGQNYSITSAPASGFVFTNWIISTNWIGGTTITGTNLLFMMASNLTLQANFAETNKPTLTITAPTSGQHMTNALATVTGTAGDIWGVNAVWYQLTNGTLTGGTWSQATTTNSYTNWSTTLTLAAGTNMVKAYAMNLGGNYSATNSVSFVSSNSFKLQLTFAAGQPLTVSGLNFVLQVSTGLVGHIQVSTNLTSWTTLTNFVGTNSTITFRDPAATNSSHRFYRAVIP